MRLLLRNVELAGQQRDVSVCDCEVVLADGEYVRDDTVRNDTVEVDARGGALLPGLHDHHLHLLAMAAASVDCSAATTPAQLGALLSGPGVGWIRATGYHESIAGDLNRHVLDQLVADRPVRVQHRSGALWILNSCGLREVREFLDSTADVERDTDGEPNGRLWRYDSRLRAGLPPVVPDLGAVGDRLLRVGITEVTDATPDLDPTAIALLDDARQSGALPQNVTLLGAPDNFVTSRTLSAGPAKLMLRDHDLPDVETIAAWVAARHDAGRAVAIHCVTSDSLAITLAALETTHSRDGDRIEHAGIVPASMRADIARLGLAVVTNPGFLATRGDDYRANLIPSELQFLYPYRSLLDAGIGALAASDAPYGDADPWAVIRAASSRTTPSGRVLSPEEIVTPWTALSGYLSPMPGCRPAPIRPGRVGGICLLREPLGAALTAPEASLVRVVATGGRVVQVSQ